MTLTQAKTSSQGILESIKSMLVLYGSVRSTPLARRVDRGLLDLPLTRGTVLTHHAENAQYCAKRFGLDQLSLRVIVDTESTPPAIMPEQADSSVTCSIEQDASPIRGVAGVLSDATRDMAEDDYIIVSSGAQIYLERLDDLVHAMAKSQADVTLVSSRDASPVGVWLIRVGVLRSIKPVGYVDMKEQALEAWRHDHRVRVVERPRAYVHPARSLSEYLDALRAHTSGYGVGATIDEDPYREDWESTFSIAEPGSDIGEGAILHDSVALQGAEIGRGAVIVRSVVCPGAKVLPGARVTDQVVTGTVRKGRAT
ncbi:MAG: LbetaH domain-containing protein [Phycisphaerales bacterium]